MFEGALSANHDEEIMLRGTPMTGFSHRPWIVEDRS